MQGEAAALPSREGSLLGAAWGRSGLLQPLGCGEPPTVASWGPGRLPGGCGVWAAALTRFLQFEFLHRCPAPTTSQKRPHDTAVASLPPTGSRELPDGAAGRTRSLPATNVPGRLRRFRCCKGFRGLWGGLVTPHSGKPQLRGGPQP